MARRRRVDPRADSGFTLLELLVSAFIFSIFIAVFAAATTSMLADVRKQQGAANELDANRKIISLLDAQTIYANAINQPAVSGDGNPYVEWQLGDAGAQQTCYQWRLNVAARQLQFRTWQPVLGNPSPAPTPTALAWSTVGIAIDPPPSGPSGVFVLAPGGALIAGRQQLTVTFVDKQANPYTRTATQISLTARNTKNTVLPVGLCGQIGRP